MIKKLPENGIPYDDILGEMKALRDEDADWRSGKTWSLVYHASEEHTEFLKKAYTMFFSENGLNPMAFPSLKKFETEVISMTTSFLGGDEETTGTMTSGGTESILMAIKAYREWSRANKPEIKEPEMIVPLSIHPAFEKASHYFDVKAVHAPLGDDYRVDVDAVKGLVNENTILIVGSAPCYPFGVVDDIPALAAIASEKGIGCHVDACLGGFLLPFVRMIGYDIPPFDFSVPGVTSISADVHKYGFAAKGASTITYRNAEWRKNQFYVYTDWPGGIYISPSMAGTRPGGALAAAWAAMNALGIEGYKKIATTIMDTSKKLIDGINAIDGLSVLGNPQASVFGFNGDFPGIFAVGDIMEAKGWNLDRLQNPDGLHLMVTPAHAQVPEVFLSALKEAVEEVKAHPELAQEGTAAMYGMMATLPDRGTVKDFVLDFLDNLFTL